MPESPADRVAALRASARRAAHPHAGDPAVELTLTDGTPATVLLLRFASQAPLLLGAVALRVLSALASAPGAPAAAGAR